MESIIFRTLLHSLWQGALLATLTALIVLFTTKSSAKIRYNLFVGCLSLFVLAVGATFVVELNQYNPAITDSSPAIFSGQGKGTIQSGTVNTVINPALAEKLVTYLSKYASSIVLIWFLIICAKSIRFMVDIRTLFQLRTSKVYHPGTVLTDKVNALAIQYGIKEGIEILQSGIIKVPMVLGHIKPLILVPLGLVNGLSMEEVDAILRHEIAHIKRRDYLVNLLQSIVEILFFFNPAVLWLANLIRTERENCCDDLAVSGVETKIDYIKALVSCQEFATAMPAYVMAVNGGKSQLINRVQRLVSSRNQSLNKLEKVIIGLVLISSVAVSSAFSGQDSRNPGIAEKVLKQERKVDSAENISDILMSEIHNETQQTDNSGTIYNQLFKDGLIKAGSSIVCTLDRNSFVINGVKQSSAIHRKYASLYLKPGQTVTYRWSGNESKHVQTGTTETDNTEGATEKAIRSEQLRAQYVHLKAIQAQKVAEADAKNAEANATRAGAKAIANAKNAQSAAIQIQAKAATNANKTQARAIEAQAAAVKKAQSGNDMTNDLIADGLIKDRKNLSYQLNIDELVVDGVKQSGMVHRKYMRKYLKNVNQRISTSVSTD